MAISISSRRLFKILITALVFGLTAQCAVPSVAGALTCFRVRSQYTAQDAVTAESSIQWRFCGQNSGRLSVYRDSDTTSIVEVTLGNSGEPVEALIRLHTGGNDRTMVQPASGNILLSNGHAVPYDFLEPEDSVSGPIAVKQTIAGTDFETHFTRQVERVTKDELAAWITTGTQLFEAIGADEPLVRIALYRDDTVAVEQVWRTGDAFWLFEKTPLRHSWRLDPLEE